MNFIVNVEINALAFPVQRIFSNHVRRITHINAIEVRIFTPDGITGSGFIYSMGIISHSNIIAHLKNFLIPDLLKIGEEISNVDELKDKWTQLWHENKNSKLNQDQLYSLACVDIAIWDIFTKEKNVSLHQLLGAAQSKILAYGTTGWLSLTQEQLLDECQLYINRGINAFKVRLGHKDDFIRVQSLRRKMGDELIIMLDANQRYTIEETTAISEQFSQFNILWLEEPTDNQLINIEKLKKVSKLPIALGENILDEKDFEEICKKKMIDYLQPDIPRCGGITGFCRVADIALKYNIPICNHLLFELSASLVSAYANGFMLEYDNFMPQDIFTHNFSAKNGYVIPPSIPGTGVELTDDARKKYRIECIEIAATLKLRCRL